MERTEKFTEPVCPTGEIEASSNPDSHSFRQHIALGAKYVGRAALCFGLGVTFAIAFGDTSVNTEHVSLKIHNSLTVDMDGGTTGDLPIGDASYDTHRGPLKLEVTVRDVPAEPVQEILRGEKAIPSISSFEEEAKEITDAIIPHAIKALGILGGISAVTWWATSENAKKLSKKSIGAGLLAGTIAVGVPLGVGIASYDEDALSKPTYTGLLPYLLNNKDALKRLDENDQKIADQSKYLFTLLDTIEYLGGSEEEEPALRVLTVADIHSRNVYPLVKSIIASYDIAFIIDGGDIVDWGMPFENGFFTEGTQSTWRDTTTSIQDLGIPYYFVRGNHDSENSTVEALRKIPNVIILDKGKIFEQNGLIITGAGDPFFNPDGGINKQDEEKKEGDLGIQTQQFLWQNPADIAVLHNPKAADSISEDVALLFSGHRHKFNVKTTPNSSDPVRLVNDSAGGAGLRTFNNEEGQETQQGFTILNYSANCALQSLDRIQVLSLKGTPEITSTHIPIENPVVDSTRVCD